MKTLLTLSRRSLINSHFTIFAFPRRTMASVATPLHEPAPTHKRFEQTSGAANAVWVHRDNYANRPKFQPLNADTKAQVCVIGAGIAGISTAYELVSRGKDVVM